MGYLGGNAGQITRRKVPNPAQSLWSIRYPRHILSVLHGSVL